MLLLAPIAELAHELAHAAEPVVDKCGRGAFYRSELHLLLEGRSIRSLLVDGAHTGGNDSPAGPWLSSTAAASCGSIERGA
jgi:hypothetical protein